MTKKLTAEDLGVLSHLQRRLTLTVRYLETVQDFPSGPEIRQVIDEAALKKDLRTLRLVDREINGMLVSLTPAERNGLEKLLLDEMAAGQGAQPRDNLVSETLRRGSIVSEKERQRVEDYLEELILTHPDSAEIEELHRILRSS